MLKYIAIAQKPIYLIIYNTMCHSSVKILLQD